MNKEIENTFAEYAKIWHHRSFLQAILSMQSHVFDPCDYYYNKSREGANNELNEIDARIKEIEKMFNFDVESSEI